MVSEYFRSRLFGLPRIAQLVAELNRQQDTASEFERE
jgi:hypothetical protein